jgi:hypothetical protein
MGKDKGECMKKLKDKENWFKLLDEAANDANIEVQKRIYNICASDNEDKATMLVILYTAWLTSCFGFAYANLPKITFHNIIRELVNNVNYDEKNTK